MQKQMKSLFVVAAAAVVLAFGACASTKNTAYFGDIPNIENAMNLASAEFTEPVIQIDDILSVQVQTMNATGNNMEGADLAVSGSSTNATGGVQTAGFLVDKNGNITVPMIGAVKVEGLTTFEAKKLITEQVAKLYVDPTVQVRFANYKITVLGEVNRPASYTVPNEKVTILDALGMAGDLTIYGKRDNILLIRDNGESKEFVRLNLNSADIFKSPYYYLRQNDVIYVEPGKGKVAAADAPRWQYLSIVASFASILVVIITRL